MRFRRLRRVRLRLLILLARRRLVGIVLLSVARIAAAGLSLRLRRRAVGSLARRRAPRIARTRRRERTESVVRFRGGRSTSTRPRSAGSALGSRPIHRSRRTARLLRRHRRRMIFTARRPRRNRRPAAEIAGSGSRGNRRTSLVHRSEVLVILAGHLLMLRLRG